MEYFFDFALDKLPVCTRQVTPSVRKQVKVRMVGYNDNAIIMQRMAFEFIERETYLLFASPRIVREQDLSTASIRVYLDESVKLWGKRIKAYLEDRLIDQPVCGVVTHLYVYESYADIHFFEVQQGIIDSLVRIDIIDNLLIDL